MFNVVRRLLLEKDDVVEVDKSELLLNRGMDDIHCSLKGFLVVFQSELNSNEPIKVSVGSKCSYARSCSSILIYQYCE